MNPHESLNILEDSSRKISTDLKMIYQNILDWMCRFSDTNQNLEAKKLLRKSIYCWALSNLLLLMPGYSEFWGNDAYILNPALGDLLSLESATKILNYPQYFYLIPFFYFGQILLLLCGIFYSSSQRLSILIFYFNVCLNRRAQIIGDGGTNLIELLMFYLIFINVKETYQTGILKFRNLISNGLSNSAFRLAGIQVCIVYAATGLYKATGTHWANGTALYYTAQSTQFSVPWIRDLLPQIYLLLVPMTYSIVVFQLAFPTLIWWRKAQPWVLFFGILFHFGIAFGMGLFLFGMAMISSYPAFFTEDQCSKLKALFPKKDFLIVAFDENCTVCMKFQKIISYFDWLNIVVIDYARQPRSEMLLLISEPQRLASMHSIHLKSGKYYMGWESITQIIARLPAISLLTPFFVFFGYLGLGPKIYTIIAGSAWRNSCRKGSCAI